MQTSEYFKRYYEANKEKIKANTARRRKEKPEETRAVVNRWHRENKERFKEYFKKYYEQNKADFVARSAKRTRAKINRTPAWLTAEQHEEMCAMYRLAAERTKETGFKWHVDHIVPLQGDAVSGLHVPWNLQVIPAIDNLKKRNTFEG